MDLKTTTTNHNRKMTRITRKKSKTDHTAAVLAKNIRLLSSTISNARKKSTFKNLTKRFIGLNNTIRVMQ